jgi:4-amino-4-deoxychorismate lyase
VSTWINGRKGTRIDCRDRGLQYGDGVFETMRVRGGEVRLLQYHLERLLAGCHRLEIAGPAMRVLRAELTAAARRRSEAVLKLIVTRGPGARGYRPSGTERSTRILTLHALPPGVHHAAAGRPAPGASDAADAPARMRLCSTVLGLNPRLAGLKTLNRLESVLARAEWRDPRVWEGLMRDTDENIVCGTMSNLFLRKGSMLLTPVLDRCGVAGVMRRWVLQAARSVKLEATERRIRWQDLAAAEEVFMSNAVVGLKSVAVIERGRVRLKFASFETAARLRKKLDAL